jgi:phosphoglycolate phosphatase
MCRASQTGKELLMTHGPGFTSICFDLDGTLVDSAGGVIDSLIFSLASHGIEASGIDWRSIIGPPLPRMLESALPHVSQSTRDQVIAVFRDHYSTRGLFLSVAFPGVDSLLQELRRLGLDSYVITNKPQGPAEAIVNHLKLDSCIRTVIGGDPTGAVSKPERAAAFARANKLRRIAFVGDGLDDLHAAERMGGQFFLAAWGYGTAGVLASRPNVACLENPEDLLALLGDQS